MTALRRCLPNHSQPAGTAAGLNRAGDFPSLSTAAALQPQPITVVAGVWGGSDAQRLLAREPGSGPRRQPGVYPGRDHALFRRSATALRPPQRKGLGFHQRRLVSNLLLMATLHPILFPDLLDSIIVSIIKGCFQ